MGGPGPKLDGAGMAKMAVLEEALATMTMVHANVEKMGVAIKNKQPTMVFVQAIKRQLTPLTTKLKMQFGMIADQVTALVLASTRGASEPMRLRTCREHVAQIKVALEIAVAQTIEKHKAKEATPARGVEVQKPAAPRPSQAVRPSVVAARPSEAVRPTEAARPSEAVRPSAVEARPSAAATPVPAAASAGVPVADAPALPSAEVPPLRTTIAGRALSAVDEPVDRRSTGTVEFDADGNPIPRRTTSATPPPRPSSAG